VFVATPPSAPKVQIQPVVSLGGADLYLADSDGTNVLRLTSARDATEANGMGVWSRDGRQIAFASNRDGNWEVWVMEADGANQRQLTHTDGEDTVNLPVGWAPDGRTVAFGSSRDAEGQNPWIFTDVYTIEVDGTGETRRTFSLNDGGFARAMAWDEEGIQGMWSPDGSMETLGTFRLVGEDFGFEETADPAGHGASCAPGTIEEVR
jgi:TolB protein